MKKHNLQSVTEIISVLNELECNGLLYADTQLRQVYFDIQLYTPFANNNSSVIKLFNALLYFLNFKLATERLPIQPDSSPTYLLMTTFLPDKLIKTPLYDNYTKLSPKSPIEQALEMTSFKGKPIAEIVLINKHIDSFKPFDPTLSDAIKHITIKSYNK